MVNPILLTRETNARFWAQTAYKIGQNLDMTNPYDRKMAKVWFDIYQAVQNAAARRPRLFGPTSGDHTARRVGRVWDSASSYLP